jgi:hypothetical protein
MGVKRKNLRGRPLRGMKKALGLILISGTGKRENDVCMQ